MTQGRQFTALDADPERLDAHEQNFVAQIRAYGWFATHVFADKEGPGFSYTTGFWLKYEYPEVIVFGLRRTVVHDTLWHMYRELQSGTRFGIGTRQDDIFRNVAAVLLPVSRQNYYDHLGWSRWFYGNDDFECLQLVWPDPTGLFPWEGQAKHAGAGQPDLTAGDWSGLGRH